MATVEEIAARILREEGALAPPEPWPTRAERDAIEKEIQQRDSSLLPTKKVTAGIIAGAVASIAGFLLSQYGIEVPPEVVASSTTIMTFLASYFVPES